MHASAKACAPSEVFFCPDGEGFYMAKPKYSKPAITVSDQAKLLLKRGLNKSSEKNIETELNTVNYYRLSGYMIPYLDRKSNIFYPGTKWKYIWNDYCLDKNLRSLLFDAIGELEITLRTRMIYSMSLAHGSRWYEDSSLFYKNALLQNDLKEIKSHWNRSKEVFVLHYNNNYDTSFLPPAWMIFETTTFGTLSKYFENLNATLVARNQIVDFFGFNKSSAKVLISWFRHLNVVRNICAHHSRLFSKTFVVCPIISKSKFNNHLTLLPAQNKLYATVCIIQTLLKETGSNFDFSNKLHKILKSANKRDLQLMGIPKNWKHQKLFN